MFKTLAIIVRVFLCNLAGMKLQDYIQMLKKLQDDIPAIVDRLVEEEPKWILGAAKRRMYQYGIDGNEEFLGTYAPFTIEKKKKSPYSKTTHVTLRDTGDWYNSLFTKYENGELFMDSTDKRKTVKLTDGEHKNFVGYGDGILEFTEGEKLAFGNEILKNLAKKLQEKFNTNIEIEI